MFKYCSLIIELEILILSFVHSLMILSSMPWLNCVAGS